MPYGDWINAELRHDVVVLVCAVSAGIHGALAPDHFADGTGAGVGFVAATLALAALVIALTLRPTSQVMVAGAAAVLAGLAGAYLLASTTGLPVLHPEPEAVDGLGLATKSIELAGLLAATSLLLRPTVALGTRPHAKGV
jgi:hypothetical protein